MLPTTCSRYVKDTKCGTNLYTAFISMHLGNYFSVVESTPLA